MEDPEGALSFDFEAFDAGGAVGCSSASGIQPDSAAAVGLSGAVSGTGQFFSEAGAGNGGSRRSFRQTVCRHWLRSLCMKGDACGFLHEYDKSRMPICRFFRMFGECREPDCVYKHTVEDMKECNMYKLGFCPNGPDCRYKHVKLPGPPPPVEEVLQKIQHLIPFNYVGSNRFFQNRNAGPPQQFEKSQFQQTSNVPNQNIAGKSSTQDVSNVQQPVQQSQLQSSQTQVQNVANNQQNVPNRTASALPQGVSRYFIVKSCNRENLELSAQQGVWATQRSNEAKLNEAFDSADNVILIFSINRTRHFQGCAKMTSKIGGFVGGGNWKYAHGTAHYGRNFSVKWLKLCELSFHKTRYLRNPYNENLPVKISRDCQELEPSIGEQLASLLYLEPDSELMAISLAAESKREEERAKGVNTENEDENPDIVPFDDNEEEEEEESEDEESSLFYGRGRGRGMMWPPQMPLSRGARPHPGMRMFPPVMMGVDGFPYQPDGFGMSDLFGMGPRPFPPYGPRFPADFGMMLPGRPGYPGGGFGMMMGPGRAPFLPRSARPVGLPSGNRAARRDPRPPFNERNEIVHSGSDPGRGSTEEMQYQQGVVKSQHSEQFGSLGDEESESEDEAPRRSRHGEGKRRRRCTDEEAPSTGDVQ